MMRGTLGPAERRARHFRRMRRMAIPATTSS